MRREPPAIVALHLTGDWRNWDPWRHAQVTKQKTGD